MPIPKLGKSKKGEDMHYSVGALIKNNNKYLVIDRTLPPYGFAGIAGHIDENETPEQALIREVQEESGLEIKKHKLLFEEEIEGNWCSKGIKTHYWYLFECEVTGKLQKNPREIKSIKWYLKEEINELQQKQKLEPVWEYWFKKLKII